MRHKGEHHNLKPGKVIIRVNCWQRLDHSVMTMGRKTETEGTTMWQNLRRPAEKLREAKKKSK